MRAVALSGFDVQPALTELAIPEPAAGEVRVRVRAASVNGFDLFVGSGMAKEMMEHRFPVVLGKDFAGEVDAVGPGVHGYAVGDRVFGVVTKPYLGDGSFAEYVTVPVAIGIATLPADIPFTDGAALGVAGATAHAVIDSAAPKADETVLVIGATGGVGTQVVQLAAATGARVIATAHSDAGREHVVRLGAQGTVNHHGDLAAEMSEAAPEGVDVVVHLAGDPGTAIEFARSGGRFVSTMLMSADQLPSETVAVTAIYAQPTAEVLERIAAGDTSLSIQQVYPLDQAQDAFDAFATGTLGKLVITTS